MKLFKRIICIISCMSLLAAPLSDIAYAEDNKITLEDKITYASSLLGKIMQEQYDAKIEEIKKEITDGGHDYTYSMESFLDKGSPFKDMDYLELLATYSAIKSRLREEGREGDLDLKKLQYVEYTYEVVNFGEAIPYKIEEYDLVNEEMGYYEKTGYRYSDEEEEIGIYEKVEDEDVYIRTGTKTVTPEREDKTYLEITLHHISPDDLYEIAGIRKEDVEEDVKRRKEKMESAANNDELRARMIVRLPDGLIGMDAWTDGYLDAIGYTEDNESIRITGDTIARIAGTLNGQVPYQWGGKSTKPGYDTTWWTYDSDSGLQKGLDCSGFVQWTYRTAGFSDDILDRLLSTHIMDANFEAIDRKDIRPGDIGLNMSRRTGHCGIYAGNGMWWHCSSSRGTVALEDGTKLGFHKIIRPVDLDGDYIYRRIKVYTPEENSLVETEEEPEVDEITDAENVIKEAEKTQEEEKKKAEELAAAEKEKAEQEAKAAKEAEEKQKAEQAKKDEEEKAEAAKQAEKIKQEAEEAAKQAEAAKKAEEEKKKAEEEAQKAAEEQETETIMVARPATTSGISDADVLLLAQLITHEAQNQGVNGWVAVGEVVMNRIQSNLYPNDLNSVVFQPHQFTNAASIKGIKPNDQIMATARGVLEGRLRILGNNDVLYFRNAHGSTGNWGKHPFFTNIGNHSFYLQ